MDKMKTLFQAIVGAFSLIVGIVTIFQWFNVSPETVGTAAFDMLYIAWPFIVALLFFVTGWFSYSLYVRLNLGASPKQVKQHIDDLNAKLSHLDNAKGKEASHTKSEKSLKDITLERMDGFSKNKAKAILAAYESEGQIDVEPYSYEVIASIGAKEGVFTIEVWELRGVRRYGKHFGITDNFRSLLKDDDVMKKLHDICDS